VYTAALFTTGDYLGGISVEKSRALAKPDFTPQR
jgi:hypothetical protein